jgi:hypothetical protein
MGIITTFLIIIKRTIIRVIFLRGSVTTLHCHSKLAAIREINTDVHLTKSPNKYNHQNEQVNSRHRDLICMREVPGSLLCRNTDYPEGFKCRGVQIFQKKTTSKF